MESLSHFLYLMFRCDRRYDGKFGKFGNFVGTKHTQRERARRVGARAGAVTATLGPGGGFKKGSYPDLRVAATAAAAQHGPRGSRERDAGAAAHASDACAGAPQQGLEGRVAGTGTGPVRGQRIRFGGFSA